MAEFGFILLAAGSASRMGRLKQLLDFGGIPLVRHAAIEALQSGCAPVVVVCGAEAKTVSDALEGLPVLVALNDRWEEGMGTSIQCGLRELDARAPDVLGMILSLADQPLLNRETFARLVDTQRQTALPIVTSQYAGTVGVPVVFMREMFPALLALPRAQGCKGIVQKYASRAALVDCSDAVADIDTPDDFAQVLAEFLSRQRAHSR